MTTPSTELDTRFSDPGAQPTSWQDTLEAINQAEIFWISTVRTDGRPHVTPLVAVWLDDALHFSTGASEQKATNLANNPRVALITGANDWQSGLDVVVEGEAVRVTDPEQLQRLAAAWAQKWDGRWRYSVDEDGFRHDVGTALVFAVRPAKVLAFAKGGFSHTRYRFSGSRQLAIRPGRSRPFQLALQRPIRVALKDRRTGHPLSRWHRYLPVGGGVLCLARPAGRFKLRSPP